MLRAFLLSDIEKTATSIEIKHTDAILNFNASGGYAYIGNDYFAYTGIASYTLTGVSGLRYPHLEDDEVTPYYGVKFSHLVSPIEKTPTIDVDKVTDALIRIIDDGYFETLKRQSLGFTRLINPNQCPEDYLKYLVPSVGIEFSDDVASGRKRRLAEHAGALACARGSLAAFRFICWHVLEYDVDVDVKYSKITSKMNDQAYTMLKPPTSMDVDARSGALWLLDEGAGVSCANAVTGGPVLTLEDAAMWTASSMFLKDTCVTFSLAHPYATASGAATSLINLHGKEAFNIEMFLDPATSILFPQYVVGKSLTFLLTRTNDTDITIWLSNSVDSDSVTITDILTPNENQLLSILYERPILTVLVNGSVIYEGTFFDYEMVDLGGSWEFGDVAGLNPYIGKLDTPHISIGKKYPVEVVEYFEHIDILRSHYSDPDKNSYMYCNTARDGFVEVTVNNDEGDQEKHAVLEYLIEEWLGAGDYSVIYTANLPLEVMLGLMKV